MQRPSRGVCIFTPLESELQQADESLRFAVTLSLAIPPERAEAQALIEWAHYQRFGAYRISELLLMIPSGAYLGSDPRVRAITMAKLKSAGFQNGVYDYLLAVPNFDARIAGLWIELKRQKLGVVSAEQFSFGELMRSMGYGCTIARGWSDASQKILSYLADISPPQDKRASARAHEKAPARASLG